MTIKRRIERLEGAEADMPVVVAYLDSPDALTVEEKCARHGIDPRQAHCITVEYVDPR